jgi:dolichol-phosphate mannosyltransferase
MVLVAVATYNELANLPELVQAVFRVLPECHLLVVDDNSPDGTGRWAAAAALRDARIRVLQRPGKLGLGSATVAALQFAVDHDYPLVVTMDADLSHDPRFLPELLAGMQGDDGEPVDVVVGSRYIPGGDIQGWPLSRRITSRCVNHFGRWWLRIPVHDISGAFRCYRTETLRELGLANIRSQGYSVFEELLYRLRQAGARFGETPITFVDRQRGVSKVSIREAARSLGRIVWVKMER